MCKFLEECDKVEMQNQAILSNRDGFTIFRFGKLIIRFRAPYSLEKYTAVKESHRGGKGFDPPHLHHRSLGNRWFSRLFCILKSGGVCKHGNI